MKDQIETKVTKHGKFFNGIDENIYNPIPIICPECGNEYSYEPTEKNKIREEKHLFVYRKCFILTTKCECGCEFETKKYLRTTFDFGELFAYLFISSLCSLFVCSAVIWCYNYESNLWGILSILSLAILLVSTVGWLYCIAKEDR